MYAYPRTWTAGGSRRDPDLDVLAKLGEELHQALDRKPVQAVAHQVRDVRLYDPEQFRGPRLRKLALREHAVHFQCELDLERAFLRVRVAKIGEYIAGSGLDLNSSLRHFDDPTQWSGLSSTGLCLRIGNYTKNGMSHAGCVAPQQRLKASHAGSSRNRTPLSEER